MRRIIPRGTTSRSCAVRTTLSCNLARNSLRSVFAYAQKRWNCNNHISITERLTGKLRATLFSNHPQDLTGSARTTGATGNASPRPEPRHTNSAPRTPAHRSRAQNPRTQIPRPEQTTTKPRDSNGIPGLGAETAGFEPARGVNPYLLSREAHSTGLCDVSSADYSRTFLPRTRTAPATHAREPVDMAEGEGFEPPVPLLTQRFSRPSLSATQTALQTCLILQEQTHTREADGTGTGTTHPAPEGEVGAGAHHICRIAPALTAQREQRGGARGVCPGPRPSAAIEPRSQPRRPKKFQDFLSGAGSSGWSRRPRESAGAVGGHSGTRIASIAWIAWYTSQREDLAGWTLSL